MKAARIAAHSTVIYLIAVLAAGTAAYLRTGSVVAWAVSAVAAAVLMWAAVWLYRGRLAGGFLAGGVALVMGLFYGYRFIATGNFLPGGAVLLASFVALFFILIGLFLSLER